ncbi:MAG TPA: hypothetical protein VJ698_15790 [Noviherbaspirillum sp.]|uniref:hypothetical protein n=1 Tax=Noviherbaspirillum sp. TaxID=1926288 RepID=UPI002B46A3C3|nr:hypothetical protein [Noviherbaspirillum sp.]HJV86928.1 hypothetical protein [Noviherbaspirillum sp.]
MGIASKDEAAALSHAAANAAIEQAYALLQTDREAVRAAHWNRLDEKTRKMVCHMAGIDAKKGKGALRDLNAMERGQIHCEARRMLRDLEIILRCAQGGAMPVDVAALAPHEPYGVVQ